MDAIDRALLNAVQTGFPVEPQPYQSLGDLVGITEQGALERLQALSQEGIIRRLGGVFDSHRLGYYSTLCSAKVPQAKIPLITEILAGVPGVTHNYLRKHAYNMWFTLIAPSKEKVEEILEDLRQKSGVAEVYSLPALRLFKIKVDFDLTQVKGAEEISLVVAKDGEAEVVEVVEVVEEVEEANGFKVLNQAGAQAGYWSAETSSSYPLSPEEIKLIRILQGSLANSITPFADLAEELGWTEKAVLTSICHFIEVGVIRRFGAVLRHQKAGFVANAMGVWQVAPELAEAIGRKMALYREVSHCYQRPTLPDWPYNLFTMIHGRSVEDCQNVMNRIALETGVKDHDMLFSTKELKKISMQYFPEE
ncbi:MAG: Lrp/AsnC family transcriptional regulator [Desulfitobacteriaceae bacterium]